MKFIRFLIATFILFALTCITSASEDFNKDANQHYELALKSFDNENLSETFIHLKNVLQISPGHLSAKLLLAKVFFNDGNFYAAEKEFEECLELGADINLVLPIYGSTLILQEKTEKLMSFQKFEQKFTQDTQFEWLLLKGQAYLKKNNPEMALKSLKLAESLLPGNTRAINTLAAFYLEQGDIKASQLMADKSLSINDGEKTTWQLKGEISSALNEYDEALKYFLKAYELDKTDPRVLRNIAKTHLYRNELTEAKQYLEQILEQSPGDPSAALLMAVVSMSEGDEKLGEQILADLSDKLTLLDESQTDDGGSTLFIKATTEYLQGNIEKARTLLGNYLGKNPGDLAAIRLLLKLHLNSNNYKRAIELLQDQQKYIAKDFGLSLQLAHLYVGERKLFTAQEQLKKLAAIAPDHPYILMLEADILNAKGQPEEALKLLNSYQFLDNEPLAFSLKKGHLQLNAGKLENALATAEQLLVKFPDNLSVLNFAAAVNLKMNRVDEAKSQLNQVLASSPGDLTAHFNHALLLKIEGQYEDAVSVAKEVLNERPQHIPSIILIARIRVEEKNYAEALDWVQKVYTYDRSNIPANELKLEIYTRTQDWDNGLKTARALYKMSQGTPKYLEQQAQLLIALDKPEQAQRPLSLLFSLWSDNPQKLRVLSKLQIESKNMKAARQSLTAAVTLDDKAFDLQLDLARLDLLESNQLSAQKSIEQLELRFGSHTEIEMLKGDLAYQENKLHNAQTHFTKAFALNSKNSRALLMLYQLTLAGEGAQDFTQLLEKHRKETQVPHWQTRLLADSYLNQGNTQLAKTQYEELAKIPELANNAEILNNLANIYAKTDVDKALSIAKKGLESDSAYPPLLDTIGWLHIEKGLFTEALTYLRNAFALDSRNPEIRYHQGLALANLDRKSEALIEFNAAIQLSDSFAGAKTAKQWIEKLEQETE